jgi:hypothetical protein
LDILPWFYLEIFQNRRLFALARIGAFLRLLPDKGIYGWKAVAPRSIR